MSQNPAVTAPVIDAASVSAWVRPSANWAVSSK